MPRATLLHLISLPDDACLSVCQCLDCIHLGPHFRGTGLDFANQGMHLKNISALDATEECRGHSIASIGTHVGYQIGNKHRAASCRGYIHFRQMVGAPGLMRHR